ncbi:hypothetical protein [Streptomyces chartreusis]|uniref:hypothetical protein n=1 Tax=Streptomyces chartreusis TaxID=1969 RepID=UPI0033A90741
MNLSRERGDLADARRDYRAVIDKRGSTSGRAAHELAEVTDDADEAIELCCAALRFGTVLNTLYDGHPRHTNPRRAVACDTRRRARIGRGTRMWAVLPHQGARAYLRDAGRV